MAKNDKTRRAPTTVFVVADSPIVRDRLVDLLKSVPVEVVGYAESAAQAVEQIARALPLAIVLDLRLREGSGLQVLESVKRTAPATTVIMLTNYATPEIKQACLNAGADYFLDKTNEYQNVSKILKQLASDRCQGDPSCRHQ